MQTDYLNNVAQLITVLVLFVAVLFLTWFVTKWTAGLQKQKSKCSSANIELIDSASLSADKYIQIVRVADKYIAVAVTKEQVTMLTEVDEDTIIKNEGSTEKTSFEELFKAAKRKKKNR